MLSTWRGRLDIPLTAGTLVRGGKSLRIIPAAELYLRDWPIGLNKYQRGIPFQGGNVKKYPSNVAFYLLPAKLPTITGKINYRQKKSMPKSAASF